MIGLADVTALQSPQEIVVIEESPLSFASKEKLVEFLTQQGIIFDSEWRYDLLFDQIEKKETTLVLSPGERLKRKVEIVDILVVAHDSEGKPYQLRETKQIVKRLLENGVEEEIEVRNRNLNSVAETMIEGEDKLFAAQRGIKEELGLAIPLNEIQFLETEVKISGNPNTAYPGLKTVYTKHHMKVILPPEILEGHPDGFVDREEAGGNIYYTYFEWIQN